MGDAHVRPSGIEIAVKPDHIAGFEFHHLAAGIALPQACEIDWKAVNGGIDSIGATDVEHPVISTMACGSCFEDLMNDRFREVRNHVVESPKNRKIRSRVVLRIYIVEYCLVTVDFRCRRSQIYVPPY